MIWTSPLLLALWNKVSYQVLQKSSKMQRFIFATINFFYKLSVSPSVNLWKKISRFSLFTNWLKFSDNLWTDRLKQAFYKLPNIFRQFSNCLISQIDANIYIVYITSMYYMYIFNLISKIVYTTCMYYMCIFNLIRKVVYTTSMYYMCIFNEISKNLISIHTKYILY